jgi:hypothetical protein
MKNQIRLDVAALLLVSFLGLSLADRGRAEGIPEPSVVLYGTIRNLAENNIRVTWGTLTWQFRNATSGQTVLVTTPVTNVLDQFSYVLEVPCEQFISASLSTNVLNLSGAPVSFDRSQVWYEDWWYGDLPMAFAQSGQTNTVLSVRDRGRLERVDLQIEMPCIDWDQNGLCDDWEMYYLGYIGVDPNGDPDGDGMSNWVEYKAGTDPGDYSSAFQFLSCARLNPTSFQVKWQSADGRYYSLLRYPILSATNVVVVQSNILASTSTHTWVDTNAPPSGPVFYRLLLEP